VNKGYIMKKRAKRELTVTYVDGVKYTTAGYQEPRSCDRTYDPAKSRYTAWHQGVVKFEHGNGKVLGTVRN
jgi:hypothetical protein